jgi:hypothetical protein
VRRSLWCVARFGASLAYKVRYIIKFNIPNFIIIKQAAALKKAIKEVKKLKVKY